MLAPLNTEADSDSMIVSDGLTSHMVLIWLQLIYPSKSYCTVGTSAALAPGKIWACKKRKLGLGAVVEGLVTARKCVLQ